MLIPPVWGGVESKVTDSSGRVPVLTSPSGSVYEVTNLYYTSDGYVHFVNNGTDRKLKVYTG